ncbi:MAG: ABC transporter ATP-binding protein, partial [Clostridiales bacterium]|nr:ABC transporter ATP-binding protein [Clostridiales bacterium]
IVGESGCGKSITANALMQLLPYPLRALGGTARFDRPEGEVELFGLSADKMRDLRGREISMIFQEPMNAFDPIFTIEFQMREALSFHRRHRPMRCGKELSSKREMTDRALFMLNKLKIPRPEQTLKSYPHQLSGGQLQRVMIAIALIDDPRLLIADEPTTALDVTIQAQILDLMNELKESRDTSIVMITHDLGVVAETCQEVAVFYAGQVAEQASVAELFHQPAHPYTSGLLRSVGSLGFLESLESLRASASGSARRELYAIPGVVPPGGEWSCGCRFFDRCGQKTEKCGKAMPALTEVAPGHWCRCFLHGDEADA